MKCGNAYLPQEYQTDAWSRMTDPEAEGYFARNHRHCELVGSHNACGPYVFAPDPNLNLAEASAPAPAAVPTAKARAFTPLNPGADLIAAAFAVAVPEKREPKTGDVWKWAAGGTSCDWTLLKRCDDTPTGWFCESSRYVNNGFLKDPYFTDGTLRFVRSATPGEETTK